MPMSTEIRPDTCTPLGTRSRPPSEQPPRKHPAGAVWPKRWWKLALVAAGVLAISATAVALIPGTLASTYNGPQLTHTITRGDLNVTVTEQGMLESSKNTEIKCKVRGSNTVTWVIEGGTVVEPGDELVRLDTKVIEETLSLTKTNAFMALATLEETKANVARAEIAIDAYRKGTFRRERQEKERQVRIAQHNLDFAKQMLERSISLFKKGYVTELEVEGNEFTVQQAELELEVAETELETLEEYVKEKKIVQRQGNLAAAKAKLEADKAGLAMDETRRDRAQEELEQCVIKAERGGLVIHPSAAAWKQAPDITEGATVHKDQVLLLMPDLTQMQVKVGIHESVVARVEPGLPARVTFPDRTIDAEVTSVASVARPAGWWTGNVVKFDTIIELHAAKGLKPGMSAEVEIILKELPNVLTIPVGAVVETAEGDFCWVKTVERIQRRSLQLGDSNDVFIEVKAGLKEGDKVVLNPLAHIEEAQQEALGILDAAESSEQARDWSATESGRKAKKG